MSTTEQKELSLAAAVSALEKCTNVLHQIISTPDTDDDNELIVAGVLGAIQDNFYLVPKYDLTDVEVPAVREPPLNAITESLMEMWNTVSCGLHPPVNVVSN